jgi:hypothetical protein
MDRNRFNADVRPYVTTVRIGTQGVAFDRLELDDWFDDYKSCNGRRPKASTPEDDLCQNVTVCRGSCSPQKLNSLADKGGVSGESHLYA